MEHVVIINISIKAIDENEISGSSEIIVGLYLGPKDDESCDTMFFPFYF